VNKKIILNGSAAILIFSGLLFSGCAHKPLADSATSSVIKPDGTTGNPADVAEAKAIEKLPAAQNGDLTASSTDVGEIPVEINNEVEKWIQYFQGRGRGYFERYLERSSRYVPMMKKVLKQNNVPEDLIYIAMIESGFSGKIKSRAKAVGFWQFIGGTGKHYGLRVSSLMDERYDPVRSTEAAAAYFKGLYNLFGNWYLAIASYNVGENRIKNMVMKNYTRDFWELAKRKQLPAETTQYIPKFLAARQISMEPEKYGFTGLNYAPPMVFDTLISENPVDLKALAKSMKVDYSDLKDLNPSLKTQFSPVIDGKASVRIPVGTSDAAKVALSDATVKNKRYITQASEAPSKVSFTRYKVKHGETLSSIAEHFEVSVDDILKVNARVHKNRVRPGMTLKIPSSAFNVIKEKKSITRNSASSSGAIYIVRNGDNLSHIAKRHDTTIEAIIKANNLAQNGRVFKGQKLVIPENL
jgi:membrane-bound lytic murein transglycosylase D